MSEANCAVRISVDRWVTPRPLSHIHVLHGIRPSMASTGVFGGSRVVGNTNNKTVRKRTLQVSPPQGVQLQYLHV